MKRLGIVALVTSCVICLTNQPWALADAEESAGGTRPVGTTAADTGGAEAVEEVVITARKRVEGIESVPATVQVVDAAQLAQAGVIQFRDLALVAPGLNISNAPNRDQYALTIRGLGSSPGNPSFDNSVSMFLDGVFTPRAREFAASLFDVSSIETIRGTEAALLGKNTSLGAVNLVTNKPGDTYRGDLLYQHEFELVSNRVEGGVDLPVVGSLKFRVAGLYDKEGGPLHNIIDGSNGPETETSAGRVIGVWSPVDSLDVTAMYQAQKSSSTGANAQFVTATAYPGVLAALAGYPGTINTRLDYRTAVYSPALGGAGREDEKSDRAALTINWRVGDHTFTAQSGYTHSKVSSAEDVAYLPGNYGLQWIDDRSKQFTQELRLVSPSDRRFEYIIGGLYLDGRYVAYSTTAFDFPPLGGPPVAGAVLTYFNQLDRAYSAFSQANYQIYGPVKLTAGLRYTKEQKSVDLARQVLQPGLFSVFVEPPYAPFSRSKSEDSVDGSIGLSYQLRRDTLLYTSWGQGTKAGGFAQAVSLLDKAEYQPEVARTTELGIKSQLDDRRWTVNVAGFYTAIRDFQLVSFDGVNFVVDNSNLRSSGIEAEIVWLPVRGLRLFANNTYADTLDTRHHTDTEFAPRWSGMGGGSFSWPAFGALQASLTLDLNYRSSELSQLAGVSAPRLSASKRLNASAGLGSPERGWEVRVLCKNLNNERTLGFAFPAPLEPPGNAAGMPLDPRTVWLQVSYKP